MSEFDFESAREEFGDLSHLFEDLPAPIRGQASRADVERVLASVEAELWESHRKVCSDESDEHLESIQSDIDGALRSIRDLIEVKGLSIVLDGDRTPEISEEELEAMSMEEQVDLTEGQLDPANGTLTVTMPHGLWAMISNTLPAAISQMLTGRMVKGLNENRGPNEIDNLHLDTGKDLDSLAALLGMVASGRVESF